MSLEIICEVELTLDRVDELFSGSFNLSTLHFILTSCPTLKQSEENGRNPTARQGSSTGRCKIIVLLKWSSPCSAGFTGTGVCAPTARSPDIPYLIFNILSCEPAAWSGRKKKKKPLLWILSLHEHATCREKDVHGNKKLIFLLNEHYNRVNHAAVSF